MTGREPRLTIGVQSFTDFELIVSDNCSDDSTAEIVKEFVDQDDRVVYTRTADNIGGPATSIACSDSDAQSSSAGPPPTTGWSPGISPRSSSSSTTIPGS